MTSAKYDKQGLQERLLKKLYSKTDAGAFDSNKLKTFVIFCWGHEMTPAKYDKQGLQERLLKKLYSKMRRAYLIQMN